MLVSSEHSATEGYRSLSFDIIEAIATREGVDATEIEPPEYEALYDVLNPEALDALFAPREDGTPREGGRVEFTYCGYDVVVTGDGDVHVQE